MKIELKIAIILLIIIIISLFGYRVEATSTTMGQEILNGAQGFLQAGVASDSPTYTQAESFASVSREKFLEIVDFLWSVGLLVIFIGTVILGIKYMLVLPEERSRIKQATTPYVIGVICIFGAVTIWKLVITILDGSIQQ